METVPCYKYGKIYFVLENLILLDVFENKSRKADI